MNRFPTAFSDGERRLARFAAEAAPNNEPPPLDTSKEMLLALQHFESLKQQVEMRANGAQEGQQRLIAETGFLHDHMTAINAKWPHMPPAMRESWVIYANKVLKLLHDQRVLKELCTVQATPQGVSFQFVRPSPSAPSTQPSLNPFAPAAPGPSANPQAAPSSSKSLPITPSLTPEQLAGRALQAKSARMRQMQRKTDKIIAQNEARNMTPDKIRKLNRIQSNEEVLAQNAEQVLADMALEKAKPPLTGEAAARYGEIMRMKVDRSWEKLSGQRRFDMVTALRIAREKAARTEYIASAPERELAALQGGMRGYEKGKPYPDVAELHALLQGYERTARETDQMSKTSHPGLRQQILAEFGQRQHILSKWEYRQTIQNLGPQSRVVTFLDRIKTLRSYAQRAGVGLLEDPAGPSPAADNTLRAVPTQYKDGKIDWPKTESMRTARTLLFKHRVVQARTNELVQAAHDTLASRNTARMGNVAAARMQINDELAQHADIARYQAGIKELAVMGDPDASRFLRREAALRRWNEELGKGGSARA